MRSVPALVLALLLACAALPPAGRAQTADSPSPLVAPTPDPLAALPADLRGEFEKTLDKATVAKRESFQREMKSATVALVKAVGFTNDTPLKDLASAARDAAARSLEGWSAASRRHAAEDYRSDPELAALNIAAMSKATGTVAALDDPAIPYTPPTEQPAWTEAVRRALDPAQLAAWEANAAGEKKERGEIVKFLDTQTDLAREQCETAVRARIAELTDLLELPAERVAKLAALGRRAVGQSLRASRAAGARLLRSMQPAGRQRMMARSQFFFNVRGELAPTEQEVWKIGLDRLLTDADRQRLGAVQGERDARRARALGQMLLVVMDEQTALTTPQRDRLLGPAEEAVKQVKALFPAGDSQNHYQFSRETFLEASTHVPEGAARAILDPVQWQHWQQAGNDPAEGKESLPARHDGRKPPHPDPAEKKDPPAVENAEPEEIERFLSDAFDEKAARERQRELAILLLRTEDAARVAVLEEPAAARLRTAARGTVEEALVSWKATLAQNVRSQLENSDQENIRNLLANLPNLQFGTNEPTTGEAENRSIWDQTVARELTAPQQARWQREVAARAAYREQATAALVLAEFDRRYQLSGAQWEKLRPPLETVLRDYGPDIRRTFGYSPGNMPWYFQTYTMFLPLMGVPDDELKTILGPDRWEHWSGSAEHNNDANWWQNIHQYHNAKLQGNNE